MVSFFQFHLGALCIPNFPRKKRTHIVASPVSVRAYLASASTLNPFVPAAADGTTTTSSGPGSSRSRSWRAEGRPHQTAGRMETRRRVKSHGCQGGGTLRTTATRGWRREGCTGGSELLLLLLLFAVAVAVAAAAAIFGVEVEEVVAGGCGGSGRWPVEEPRRRGEGLAITLSVRPSEAKCFLDRQFVESRFRMESVLAGGGGGLDRKCGG